MFSQGFSQRKCREIANLPASTYRLRRCSTTMQDHNVQFSLRFPLSSLLFLFHIFWQCHIRYTLSACTRFGCFLWPHHSIKCYTVYLKCLMGNFIDIYQNAAWHTFESPLEQFFGCTADTTESSICDVYFVVKCWNSLFWFIHIPTTCFV